MFIGILETRHWSFMACGDSDEDVRKLMLRAWAKHCRETGASPDYMVIDDVMVYEIEPGQVYRDDTMVLGKPRRSHG